MSENPLSISPGATSCPNCGAIYVGFYDVCGRCGSRLLARPASLAIGSLLDDKFEILSLIGVGGMGEVYKAMHLHLRALRCIKVMKRELLSDESFRNRFLREARVATQIQHPNVAVLHDFSTLKDGSFYMVSEFIDGTTLRQWGALHGRFQLDTALEIMLQVLSGLDYCHRRGLLHRDISADNIMISGDGQELSAKIIDLGIAKLQTSTSATTSTVTQIGLFVGNPKYSSPEQLGELEDGEELDGRSDLYSLGVVLYEMLLGVPLFKSRTPHGYIVKHLTQAPTPFKEIDPALEGFADVEAVLFKVLAKNRRDRYADAKDFARAVRQCLSNHHDQNEVVAVPQTVIGPALSIRKQTIDLQPRANAAAQIEALRRSEEEEAYRSAIATSSVDEIRTFLTEHPESTFRSAAERAIQELNEFTAASATDREEQWISFLHRWPDGLTAVAARARLQIRQDERADLDAAKRVGTAAAFQSFIEKHSDGRLRDLAGEHLREAFAFDRAGRDGIAGWNHFLETYPEGLHRAAAERERARAIDQFELDRAMHDDTAAAWQRFLGKKLSDPELRQRGERRLAEIEDAAYRLVVEMRSQDRVQPFLEMFPSSRRADELRRLAGEWERLRIQGVTLGRFLDYPPAEGNGIRFDELDDRELDALVQRGEEQNKVEHLDYLAKRLVRSRAKSAAAAAKRVRKKLGQIAKDAEQKRLAELAAQTDVPAVTLRQEVIDPSLIPTQVLDASQGHRSEQAERATQELAPAATVGALRPRLVSPFLIAGIAGLVIATLAATLYFTRPRTTEVPVSATAPAATISTTSTGTRAPSPPLLSPLIIDARPWGEIVSIKDKNGREIPASDGDRRYTPLSVLVAPGHYTVTLANPSSREPQVIVAEVKQSGGRCEARFPGVDVNEYFKQAGWK
jgi:serine/threonine protein kinase